MAGTPLPPGTTLLIKGGRSLLPDSDWNNPDRSDIAIAGDRIAGLAPDYDRDSGIEIIEARDNLVAARLRQRALSLTRRTGERYA